MANTTNLKATEEVIKQYITPNGVNTITAQLLQSVLLNITQSAERDIEGLLVTVDSMLQDYVFETDNLADGCVTTPKIADYAVTTRKLGDKSVTRAKLADDVSGYLLTEEMRNYLVKQVGGDKQKEAQALFVGRTENAGTTFFTQGDVTIYQAKKTVTVRLTFDGSTVLADSIPCGWTLVGDRYEKVIGMDGGPTSVPSTLFTYTPQSGYYKGITVEYYSNEAEVRWDTPVYYGFVPNNSESMLTSSMISQLNISTDDVVNSSATLKNNTATDGYFCVITKGDAEATQLGISVLDCEKNAPNFTSPNNSAVTMSGYKVWFSKNQISAGKSLGNVNLKIRK